MHIKTKLKKFLPLWAIKIHRIHRIKKMWPTCDIRTPNINLDKCVFGKYVRIPATAEVWGGSIGDYTYIGEYCSIPNAKIGKFCSIGARCSIGGWQHDYYRETTSPRVYREVLEEGYIEQRLQVTIGNDVWVGYGVIITSNCHNIGNGAVLAAGSVVTKDVPPYAVVAGCPARIIKYRFDEEIQQIIERSKWWEKTPDQCMAYYEYIDNPKEFCRRITDNGEKV